MRPIHRVALLGVGLLACGQSPGGTGTGHIQPDVLLDGTSDAAAEEDQVPGVLGPLGYAPCPRETHIGGFTVTLAEDYTGVSGQVADGVVPGNIPAVVAEEGPCQLLAGRVLFCDPPCVPGETCGEEGACIAYPTNQSVGEVTVQGLVSPLAMEPKWGDHYNNPGTMEHPGFEAGAELLLVAAGDELAGFSLQGVGVPALEVSKETVQITQDSAATVTWEAPDEVSPAKIHLELNINNHGSTSAWVSCHADDTGTLELPVALITQLYATGISGFPSLSLTRQSADSTDLVEGCVEFRVASTQTVPLQLDGVTSCTTDKQCPPGQACGTDLQCQ